jgi:hypothetical protein
VPAQPIAETAAQLLGKLGSSLWCYIGAAVVVRFFIRAVITVFTALHLNHGFYDRTWASFWRKYRIYFKGWDTADRDGRSSDLWLPFFFGLIELLVYPFLLSTSEGVTTIGRLDWVENDCPMETME